MVRKSRATVVAALCCSMAGVGLVGCEDGSAAEPSPSASGSPSGDTDSGDDKNPLNGTERIEVAGASVNVSCSGGKNGGKPVIVLLHGGGDDLKKMAGLQKNLSEKNRVCSYDRLGAGASDQPDGPQTLGSTGKVLTGVLDRVAGDAPVVLAGHSLGGLIAARYAPDHQDRVKGLALLDATSPTQQSDITREIPESATGPAAQLREQTLSVLRGGKPERLTVPDGRVRSAGDIPVQVIKHGKRYLEAVPEHGPGLEAAWSKGQRAWLAVSSNSTLRTAKNSEHYIHVDEPALAVRAIQQVAQQAADHG